MAAEGYLIELGVFPAGMWWTGEKWSRDRAQARVFPTWEAARLHAEEQGMEEDVAAIHKVNHGG